MTLQSPNLSLPYLAPAQAQKHVTHNEALRMIDALVQLSVINITQGVLIGPTPSGIFTDYAHHIAAFQDGAWAYFIPQTGWRAFDQNQNTVLVYDGSVWSASDLCLNPASLIGVNATADTANRLSVKSPATLFDHEGSGHQIKLNKDTEGDTGSVLLQTGYTGHAEIGLTGDNDLHVKVSADGSTFSNAMITDHVTGDVSFPQGHSRGQMTGSVTSAGGTGEVYGPPNLSSVTYNRGNLTLTQNRMYFSALYVDRPTVLTGGFVSLYQPSSTSGAVFRAGIYHLGAANGDDWDIGDLVVDFGTQSADQSDNKVFDLDTPVTLQPGWYVSAVGINGAAAEIRYVRLMTPGVQHFMPHSSGASSDIRMAGAGIYLFSNNAGSEIVNGLSIQWPDNPVSVVTSPSSVGYMTFIPRWQAWA